MRKVVKNPIHDQIDKLCPDDPPPISLLSTEELQEHIKFVFHPFFELYLTMVKHMSMIVNSKASTQKNFWDLGKIKGREEGFRIVIAILEEIHQELGRRLNPEKREIKEKVQERKEQ